MKKLLLALTLVIASVSSAQLKEPGLLMFKAIKEPNSNILYSDLKKLERPDIMENLAVYPKLSEASNRLREAAKNNDVKKLITQLTALTKRNYYFVIYIYEWNYEQRYSYSLVSATKSPVSIKSAQDLTTEEFNIDNAELLTIDKITKALRDSLVMEKKYQEDLKKAAKEANDYSSIIPEQDNNLL